MRVRRAKLAEDLRTAPVDGVDVFLLTRIVDTMPLAELVAISPCSPDVTRERIDGLAELGFLELLAADCDERIPPLTLGHMKMDGFEDALTLRPPPMHFTGDEAVTIWPTKHAPLRLAVDDLGETPHTGVRARPMAPGAGLPTPVANKG